MRLSVAGSISSPSSSHNHAATRSRKRRCSNLIAALHISHGAPLAAVQVAESWGIVVVISLPPLQSSPRPAIRARLHLLTLPIVDQLFPEFHHDCGSGYTSATSTRADHGNRPTLLKRSGSAR